MGTTRARSCLSLGCLFLSVSLLILAALVVALVAMGEVPLYAPRLTGFEPDPGSAFRPDTPITLTFDQPMDPGSVQASFALIPAVSGSFCWNAERTQFTFTPEAPGYETGRKYLVRLGPGVRAGTLPRTTMQGTEWSISLEPLLASSGPPMNQRDLGAWLPLEATLNYPLDCDLTVQTFVISPPVAGQVVCADRTLAFNPSEPLAPATTYTARFGQLFIRDDPSPRSGTAWEFTTAPALTVVDASPVDRALVENYWTPVRITFNRPVLSDSAIPRFSVTTSAGEALRGRVTWESNGASLLFEPDGALEPATRYQVVLGKGVQDELGFELAGELFHSFNTEDMVSQPSPSPGSTQVALDSQIRLPFTRPMDHASVEAGLLVSPALDATLDWEQDTLVLAPRAGLAGGTTYQMALAASIQDASGAPLATGRHWSFDTQAFLLDASIPEARVLLELRQPISLTFALPMDRASVRSALTISPETPGNLIWRDDDRAVAFHPQPGWLAGAEYQISLSGSARAAIGQRMGRELAWRFGTGVARLQFGEGPNVQVMDASGTRSFQMSAQGADVADFYLYAITPTQFLELYSPGAQTGDAQPAPIAELPVLTRTVAWREALARPDGEEHDGWHTVEAHVPADVPPGIYVLTFAPPVEARDAAPANDQLLVVLTNHRLVLKQALTGSGSGAHAQVVAWDTDIGSGAPVVSATVQLYDGSGTLRAEGLTGSGGLLTLDVPGDPAPLFALSTAPSAAATAGGEAGDVTVCGLSGEWGETGDAEAGMQLPRRSPYTIYTYIDRSVYSPGLSIRFKTWLRADDDVSYTLPLTTASTHEGTITVRLRDARDNVAATPVFTPTRFGTICGEFQLSREAMPGTWHLETEVDGVLSQQALEVEAYRTPTFEVTIQTPQRKRVAGEIISATLDAAYNFGQPVSGADVELLAFSAYVGADAESKVIDYGDAVWQASTVTDAAGRAVVSIPTDRLFESHESSAQAVLALQASVTDGSGQTATSYRTITIWRTPLDLSLFLERHSYQPGEAIPFIATVHDRSGQPIAGIELAAQVLGSDDVEVTTAAATTDQLGKATFSVSLPQQGRYQLRVRSGGVPLQQAVVTDWLWIYDPGGNAPWYGEGRGPAATLHIEPDSPAHRPGDQARLAIYAPVTGPGLLTLERGSTRQAEPIDLVAGTNLISIPIRAGDAPNIHVKVSQFSAPGGVDSVWDPNQTRPEAELVTAHAELLVPVPNRRLTVTLTPDQASYHSGDQANLHLKVTDYQGRPVVADVSLAVVDEANYALASDRSSDPFDVFYAPRPDLVRTTDSLRPTRRLYPQSAMSGAQPAEVTTIADALLDTAYWAPTIATAEDGEAVVTFVLPDNLTQWRVLARAITTDTLVGQATASLVVTQAIAVRPVVPAFLVERDTITMTAVVQNYGAEPVSATVELDLKGLVIPGDPEHETSGLQVISVPARGMTAVAWPVEAQEPGEAQVSVRATAARQARVVGRDDVLLPLTVRPLVTSETLSFAGTLSRSQPSQTITFTLASGVVGELNRLAIGLAPSIGASLLEGVKTLARNPFGSVEQTVSYLLPTVAVARAADRLGLDSVPSADLPNMVGLALQTLYSLQHEDGGWGWLRYDNSEPKHTAYALMGLATARQAGFGVDSQSIERAADALQAMLPDASPRSQAYAAYVMASIGQPLSLTLSYTDALGLDLFSQAAYAMALSATGDVTGSEVLMESLREAAIPDASGIYWPDGVLNQATGHPEEPAGGRRVMDSAVRTTAMVADALARLDAASPLLPKAAGWLMAHRQGQAWGDTQKTSYAILALTDYLLAVPESSSPVAFQIYVNDQLWQTGTTSATITITHAITTGEAILASQPMTGSQPVTMTMPLTIGQTISTTEGITGSIPLTPTTAVTVTSPSTHTYASRSLLHTGVNTLRVLAGRAGDELLGNVYFTVNLTTTRGPDDGAFPAYQSDGSSIAVHREYTGQDGAGSATSFRQGEFVQVSLSLDLAAETWYVLVDDPFPAGFVPVESSLAAGRLAEDVQGAAAPDGQADAYSRLEFREDRAVLLITHLTPGVHTYTYLLQATCSGSVTAMPTQVYPMYESEAWSQSESLRLCIGPP